MDNEVNLDFGGFDSSITQADIESLNSSNAGGLQQLEQWAPYRSTVASNSEEDLSMYNYGGLRSETYSSSEGEIGDSSINDPRHSHWNNDIDYYCDDADIDDNLNSHLILPPIRTSSPPGSSPTQSPLDADSDLEANSLNLNLKRPRAPVAADLDTANILPSEHRRKRMKPARVTHTE